MSIDTSTLTPDVQVTTDIELVTPELAREMLENTNRRNRRIRKNQVQALARDMDENNWLFTGAPLTFDWDGTLLDGQHRLAAVVESGKAQNFVVMRGLDPNAQSAMDIGSRRLAYDALKLRGVEGDMKNAAAIARAVYMYDSGRVPTHLETIRFVEDHAEELEDAVAVSEMVRRSGQLTGGSFYGAAFYILARIDAHAAADFFEKLASGAELEKGSPILLLRKNLSKGLPYGFGRGAWHFKQNFAVVVHCWNAWRDGKELFQMRVPKELPEAH
jgi:hypothetical protein